MLILHAGALFAFGCLCGYSLVMLIKALEGSRAFFDAFDTFLLRAGAIIGVVVGVFTAGSATVDFDLKLLLGSAGYFRDQDFA